MKTRMVRRRYDTETHMSVTSYKTPRAHPSWVENLRTADPSFFRLGVVTVSREIREK